MSNKKKLAILSIITCGWLFFMWRLSSADGEKTFRDSMQIARPLAKILYEEPTAIQVEHLHILLRKMAHIFLYAVFGTLAAIFWKLLLAKIKLFLRAIPAALCCLTIAFLDELQKIFIEGRHFSFSESILNTISSWIMILIVFFLYGLIQHSFSKNTNRS